MRFVHIIKRKSFRYYRMQFPIRHQVSDLLHVSSTGKYQLVFSGNTQSCSFGGDGIVYTMQKW